MPRPLEALVHTDALAHNLARARAAAGSARVWAVLGADACGHGIERVYGALRAADGFALHDLAEAERVRALGWRGPILLLEGALGPRDLEACSRLMLWHAVHDEQQLDWLAMHKTRQPHRVFLRVRDGAVGPGFAPVAFRSAWARLNALPQVEEITLLAQVAHPRSEHPRAVLDLPGERCLVGVAALAAAAGTAGGADWVGVGGVLYGSSSDVSAHGLARAALRPAMTLRSVVVAVQRCAAGGAIGVVACGHADGYPRAAPGAPVLVDGVRTRTVGNAETDTLAVDLQPVLAAGRHAGPGGEVTLWGLGPRGSSLPVDEVARAAGTSGCDLLRALGPRVPVRTTHAAEP